MVSSPTVVGTPGSWTLARVSRGHTLPCKKAARVYLHKGNLQKYLWPTQNITVFEGSSLKVDPADSHLTLYLGFWWSQCSRTQGTDMRFWYQFSLRFQVLQSVLCESQQQQTCLSCERKSAISKFGGQSQLPVRRQLHLFRARRPPTYYLQFFWEGKWAFVLFSYVIKQDSEHA